MASDVSGNGGNLRNERMRMSLKAAKVSTPFALQLRIAKATERIRHLLSFPEPDMDLTTELEYVGFWPRMAAAIVDLILLSALAAPLLLLFYDQSFLVHSSSNGILVQLFILGVLPPLAITTFWIRRHATPGKIAISAIIIDEKTAGPPSVWQHLGRYCAYFLSVLPLGLGFFWIVFSPKKQAWHDRLAGTLVVRIRQ
jgi:uncharacterized RDD family membrane protein YckC